RTDRRAGVTRHAGRLVREFSFDLWIAQNDWIASRIDEAGLGASQPIICPFGAGELAALPLLTAFRRRIRNFEACSRGAVSRGDLGVCRFIVDMHEIAPEPLGQVLRDDVEGGQFVQVISYAPPVIAALFLLLLAQIEPLPLSFHLFGAFWELNEIRI